MYGGAFAGGLFFVRQDTGREKIKLGTKQLVFSSMAMALAMVTSMIKLVDMPMGGSVTLFSMFFYLSYRLLVWPKGGIDDGGCLWLFAVDCGPLYH